MNPENKRGNNISPKLSQKLTRHPFVSIIIPVYNDENGIRDTLLALFKQNYPGERFEIIIIDNNSTDDTHKIILEIALGFKGNIVFEKEKKSGSYAARNKGLEVSKGEIIAFIDSDMTVEPDWLQKGVGHINNEKSDYVGCRIKVYSENQNPSLCERYQKAVGFPINEYLTVDGYAPTACLFVRKKVFDEAGIFDGRLLSGGDVEFGTRVRDQGFKMSFDPDNIMYHPAIKTFTDLLQKQKRVTLGQIKLRRLFPERFKKNSPKDIFICLVQCLPIANPSVLKKLSDNMVYFIPLFGLFYILRLYTNGLKILKKCVF